MENYVIGLLATGMTSFALVPQIVKTYRTKSSKDLSLFTLVQYTIGVTLWLLYGRAIGNWILIFANSIGLTSFLILIAMKVGYEKKDSNRVKFRLR